MTYGMKWTTLAVLALIVFGVLIGHAQHARNEQTGKFNMDCVNSGGVLQYNSEAHAIFCNKQTTKGN